MSDYTMVKSGVSVDDVTDFMIWSRNQWPVVDFGKYGRKGDECIIMIFPQSLNEEVFVRVMNGDFSEENITERFYSVYPNKRK